MQNINLLGIPFDFGQDHIGVRLASSYLREKGLVKRLNRLTQVNDKGDLSFPFKLPVKKEVIKSCHEASLASQKISETIESISPEDFLLNIGGDHGMALGTIHGVLSHRPDTVVIWVDAHGDINTPETTPSGNFHGMPLAFLLKAAKHPDFEWMKNFILPNKLVLIGPRDLDQGEKEIIERLSIQYYSSEDLNRVGAQDILEIALHKADPFGTCPIHLSFDVDVFDQSDIHSTGTRVSNGPELEEVFLLGGLIADTGRLKSMDVVELNPQLGIDQEITQSTDLVLDFIEATMKQVFTRPYLAQDLLQRALNNNLFEV